jgi:hypothetical protein
LRLIKPIKDKNMPKNQKLIFPLGLLIFVRYLGIFPLDAFFRHFMFLITSEEIRVIATIRMTNSINLASIPEELINAKKEAIKSKTLKILIYF